MKDALGKDALCGRKAQESSIAQLGGNGGRVVEWIIQENTLRGLIRGWPNVRSDFSIYHLTEKPKWTFWLTQCIGNQEPNQNPVNIPPYFDEVSDCELTFNCRSQIFTFLASLSTGVPIFDLYSATKHTHTHTHTYTQMKSAWATVCKPTPRGKGQDTVHPHGLCWMEAETAWFWGWIFLIRLVLWTLWTMSLKSQPNVSR